MPRPRAPKLLRRIGYASALFLLLCVLAIGGLFLIVWLRNTIPLMDQTRTHAGPLVAHGQYDLAQDAIPVLALLPGRENFARGGLRFAAVPELGWHWYAVSLRDTAEGIDGTLVTVESRRGNEAFTGLATTKFTLPRAAYATLMEKLDGLADGYWGNDLVCLDGEAVVFERIGQQGTKSGSGNACADHYNQISDAVLAAVRQAAKPPYLLPNRGWFSSASEAQKDSAFKKWGFRPQ